MLQMRARGFALRDQFADVLKGLLTIEEAWDTTEQDRSQPTAARVEKPRNPLDLVAKPAPVAIPAMTSDPQVIAEAMADTVEETVTWCDIHHLPEPCVQCAKEHEGYNTTPKKETEAVVLADEGVQVVEDVAQKAEPASIIGFALLVPGKDDPFSVHQDLDEWANAYEDLADKTARAGKRPARERMTALKELRMANEDTIQRIDSVKRIRHTASYSQRIKALGAAIAD
jgi:hypothetical protein